MKRTKIIFATLLISIFNYSPAFGQDILTTEIYDEYNDSVTYYANANFVNIRKHPNTDCEILGQLLYNTSVEVLDIDEEWSCISTEDGIAFVYNTYLSETEMPKMEYTQDELYIMAHVLAGECQSLPDIEQKRVGSVVLNRVKSSKYPDTIKDVVFQRGQYACVRDGNYYREPTGDNWENAKWLLEYGSILPENVVYQSKYKQGVGVFLDTGYHYYCYR